MNSWFNGEKKRKGQKVQNVFFFPNVPVSLLSHFHWWFFLCDAYLGTWFPCMLGLPGPPLWGLGLQSRGEQRCLAGKGRTFHIPRLAVCGSSITKKKQSIHHSTQPPTQPSRLFHTDRKLHYCFPGFHEVKAIAIVSCVRGQTNANSTLKQ